MEDLYGPFEPTYPSQAEGPGDSAQAEERRRRLKAVRMTSFVEAWAPVFNSVIYAAIFGLTAYLVYSVLRV